MPVSKSLKVAQEKYRERNKEKGMMRVNVWVPVDNAEELRDIANAMRIDFKKKQAVQPRG